MSLTAAFSLAFSALASMFKLPWSIPGISCEPEPCSSGKLEPTGGALWPGIAASKIVTVKIAPATIPAWISKRTAELRTDMTRSPLTFLPEVFPALSYLTMLRSRLRNDFTSFAK